MPEAFPSVDHVSLAAGLDQRGAGVVDRDPDHPHETPHESHDLAAFDRWLECDKCGVRDYWPGVLLPCPGRMAAGARDRKAPPAPIPLSEALDLLRRDLVAFGVWWGQKDLGDTRPDMAEWCAEFLAWTHDPGGRL